MLTTRQAAAYLQVSEARIRQLIAAGAVGAEKAGKAWLVDQASLDAYASHAKAGRPCKTEAELKSKLKVRRFTLMSRNHEVARCCYDPVEMKFSQVQLLDDRRAPLALVGYQAKADLRKAFNTWWEGRAVPDSRPFLAQRLTELGLQLPTQIPLRSAGLSLSDQYWLREEGSGLAWKDVNFFRNGFDLGAGIGAGNAAGADASTASPWMNAVGLNSPDNTTDGMLSKRWLVIDGQRCLIKGNGSSGREVHNEVLATRLYRRLLPSNRYVEYRFASWRDQEVCVCPSFLGDEEEFIPAWYVYWLKKKSNNHSMYRHYCQCAAELGVVDAANQLDRMLVCDSILANTDRHWGNFGIIRNVETLSCRVAPIFDTGSSLWSHVPNARLAAGLYSFTTKPFFSDPQRQLDLVQDDTWFHPEALEGFPEEVEEYIATHLCAEGLAHAVAKGVEQRIVQVNAWAKRTPTHDLPIEWRNASEQLEWVWV